MPKDLTHLDTIGVEDESDADDLPAKRVPQVDDIFTEFDRYVRMAARGEKNGVLIESRPGIGKSHRVDEVLQDEQDKDDDVSECHSHTFVNGYVSPLAMHETLYRNQARGNVLILDDISFGGGNNAERTANLLKAALEGEGSSDKRVVEWRSASSRLAQKEIPEAFQFNGTIIIIGNDYPESEHWDAVRSRCLERVFEVNHSDRMRLLREVAKADHGHDELEYEDRIEMAEWLTERCTKDMDDVDLRTLVDAFELRVSSTTDEGEWKKLILDQLGYGRRERVGMEAIARTPNYVEAQAVYRETIREMPSVEHEEEENWFLHQFGDETRAEFVDDLYAVEERSSPPEDSFVGSGLYREITNVGDCVERWKAATGMTEKSFYNYKNRDLNSLSV